MNTSINQVIKSKPVQALEQLLKNDLDAKVLKRDLIELYFNYSRQLIGHLNSDTGIAPIGDLDGQLYSLVQVIAVIDADSETPLFSDTNSWNSKNVA